ncbi:MAG: OmpA family protein [Geminicoccaceae bacterium]
MEKAVLKEEIANLRRQASAIYSSQIPKEKGNITELDEFETPLGKALGTVEPLIVYFDIDRSDLSSESKHVVESFAESLLASNPRKVLIAGYSDTSASAESSLEISQERAATVMETLLAAKVPRSLFLALEANGEDNLAIKTPDGTREENNRRVVITPLY